MAGFRKILGIVATSGGVLYASHLMAAESGEAKAGLPQLDTALFPEQLFWLAVTFGLLYLLMAFVALPRVRSTQVTRKETIAAELVAAMAANESAKVMVAQADKALADARSKAQATVSEITAQAAKESSEKQSVQHQSLSKRLHEAEVKITASRDAAVKEVQGTAAELASSLIEKVAGLKMQVRA